jgi:hypothetical protein
VRLDRRETEIRIGIMWQFRENTGMNAVEDIPDFGCGWVGSWIGYWGGFATECFQEVVRDQGFIGWSARTESLQTQPILGHCNMTDLPRQMRDTTRRNGKPLGESNSLNPRECIPSGKVDLIECLT